MLYACQEPKDMPNIMIELIRQESAGIYIYIYIMTECLLLASSK